METSSKSITLRATTNWLLTVAPAGKPNAGQIFANGREDLPEIFELIELGSDQRGRKVALRSLSTETLRAASEGQRNSSFGRQAPGLF